MSPEPAASDGRSVAGWAPAGLAPDRREHLRQLEDSGHLWFAPRRQLLGRLVLAAPACRWLWSRLDLAAGHRRRCSYQDLEQLLTGCGWRVVHHTHSQLLLLPLVWLVRRCSWRSAQSMERFPPRLVGRLLGLINRIEVAMLGSVRLPLGSWVFGSAQRCS